MKIVVVVLMILSLPSSIAAKDVAPRGSEQRAVVDGRHDGVLISSGTADGLAARETAGPDTFVLYGGPDDLTEGKFQLANGTTPDWGGGNGLPGRYGGGPDAWIPVDLTDQPVYWHQSTFNAANLNNNGPGNQALWCGVAADDPIAETWGSPPGLGNSWNEGALYESDPVADPSAGQEVQLDFFFNYDLQDVTWDFFKVEYDSAGTWVTVMSKTGLMRDENDEFPAPGLQFSVEQEAPIWFEGNDYGGDASDQIRIRLLVTSDGAWSDEDGFAPTVAGAAQVDDITLTTSQGTFTEDFEGPGPYLFDPERQPFAGDFTDIYPNFTDIDPCRDNNTPVIGFLDYGQDVRNGPSPDDVWHIPGGSLSPGIDYGIPGAYVFNTAGGVSFGEVSVTNEIWSPEIYLDLPGPEDDDPAFAGKFIRWSGWTHLPLTNGVFYVWHVRYALPGQPWSRWTDRNFAYYGDGVPVWGNYRQDVSDLIPPGAEKMQVALGGWDYASCFECPQNYGTPSPVFDNVAVYKYRLPGPVFATREIDMAQDGFPVVDSIDASTPASRDALDIPFSMARDVNSGDLVNVPGDSIVADVVSVIGDFITDIRMVWALKTNPLFEDAIRSAPSRAEDENVVAGPTGTVWTGEVAASVSTTSAGAVINDRYYFDLPDVDFMYPGDVLHYYIQATDWDGRVSTLPHDVTGFMDFAPSTAYDRAFTVRGLPTITDASGAQPPILVWNDFGRRGGEDEWLTALSSIHAGYREGVDFDTYTTQGPTSGVGNGLGSAGAHGASADQLSGYEHLIYFAGDLDEYLLSDGSNNSRNDKGDDLGVLEDWQAIPGTRNVVYFGDHIATAVLDASAAGAAYVGAHMGVAYGDADVRDVIGGQTAPIVVPDAAGPFAPSFGTQFVAYGGCLTINQFDQIQPAAGASAGHLFTDGSGIPIPTNPDPLAGGVASVIYPQATGVSITFPFALQSIRTPQARLVDRSARAMLLGEVLSVFFGPTDGPLVGAPAAYQVALSTFPNPFNPSTMVKFTAAIGSRGSVKVYNLRGELVRTLHTGEFQTQEFTWDGTDSRGASVASGVYVVRAESEGKKFNAKVALVK